MLISFARLSKKYPVVLILTIALFLGSCSPMRKAMSSRQRVESNSEQQRAVEQQTKTDSTANTSASDSRHTGLNMETTTEQTTDEEVITTVREYDTSKPTDDKTGTPPLKKETTQTRRKADTGKQKQTVEQTTDEQRESAGQVHKEQEDKTVLQEQTNQQSNTDTQADTDEKRGLNTLQQILCGLGVLVVVGVLVWLGGKLKKRILNH